MPNTRADLCITTVTDEAFLPGTLVLLASYLRHNPWFRGKFVVIHDGLSNTARSALSQFPNLELHEVAPALKDRVTAIAEQRPELAPKIPIFYSIEAFNLRGYHRVLKIDSDVLCNGDARALFSLAGALHCAADVAHFRNQVRDLQSYAAIDRSDADAADPNYATTFNAGVMLFDPLRLQHVYDDLLSQLEPDRWNNVVTGHSDSVLLNRYFHNQWECLPATYNYFITPKSARWERAPLTDAVFIHYLGKPKPWQTPASERDASMSAEQRIAFTLWHDAQSCSAR